jgi:hypothetical protein
MTIDLNRAAGELRDGLFSLRMSALTTMDLTSDPSGSLGHVLKPVNPPITESLLVTGLALTIISSHLLGDFIWSLSGPGDRIKLGGILLCCL